jgi:hypothetical protein
MEFLLAGHSGVPAVVNAGLLFDIPRGKSVLVDWGGEMRYEELEVKARKM